MGSQVGLEALQAAEGHASLGAAVLPRVVAAWGPTQPCHGGWSGREVNPNFSKPYLSSSSDHLYWQSEKLWVIQFS